VIIEKAKGKLSTTTLSVAEIAYELGFERPQSFNKLFKNKTNRTPLEFRASSSLGANYGKLDLGDLMSEHKKYKTYGAYSQAKLANLVCFGTSPKVGGFPV